MGTTSLGFSKVFYIGTGDSERKIAISVGFFDTKQFLSNKRLTTADMSSWYIEWTSTPSTATVDHIAHAIHQPLYPSLHSLSQDHATLSALTEMIKLQNPLPSSLRVPIQNAQSDTSLLAVGFLDDDRYDVDVSGFSQVLDPDWVGRSGAARSNQNSIQIRSGSIAFIVIVVWDTVPVSKNEGFDMMLGDKIGLTRHQA